MSSDRDERLAAHDTTPTRDVQGATRDGMEPPRRSAMQMRRSRGAFSGFWLVLLGLWGALIPFVGPYFSYAFGSLAPWTYTADRLWLNILPGIAVLLGGLILAPSGHRLGAGFGAWLALVGGIWFIIGPTVSQLWGTQGPAAPIGPPIGGTVLVMFEQLGYYYALGALVTTLAAGALGRISVRSVRDA
ncbi:hypothetical protein [Pseudonocardia asaccharolytica]|uniref:Uncharacterized protein n=1 Tax=Pseudonocardia asaccharolytica DSM 44247 = NBRC 16224 TaxID=1123024 RepID=A0A511D2K3_9PSEU|nr:hypothetical protein [Pseudonocardia asaccharolytica]GEL19016.1 hypothetical protein PA7_28530 [Pseudonocardia asaccharolytica DSM 44247 = NBRC 16224]